MLKKNSDLMVYKIKITAKAKQELKNLSIRHKNVLNAIYEELKDNPYLGKPLTRELTGRFSYRVGVYRIIYNINERDKTIFVITAGHRGVVYK
ncbi:type II toxin-antitoxin system mRNA interferase toxin, RelE/StbE family [Candidatus Roizmanbacteria bacterium CG11_big_fil_rev_8_21_14_0_20_36_8]|uniref:Type II toxin-antitoxin system mRNA interferase toxin, RelE/StbE family n=2 Tax=Candidatus Roizmaniibacteriota TaxID=1752723 RepID=A0A2M6ITV4_9BACT|nr:MAG: type II toxin-antitoxin system mRNA interferase toxin, RelE/StbE family [Candidatus Roizmanbacteria bacterium CG11_big_fil_rev_8_21_14_0_20_36_8]PIZ64675.1 MAG: type II toxin-antitoxin system mRNA interferase toxin, RelE/StbE family [Candidatus Roizmanbacteria bacterium CG_4_10_14_0_2_um_filter_36_9]